MDLWTTAADTDVRNIMLGTSLEGRLLMITFNATREMEPEFGAIGERMIASLRVRESE